MTLGTSAHSATTALSNGSRPYDDLESEDDLDREDITFPSDAGKIKFIACSSNSFPFLDNEFLRNFVCIVITVVTIVSR